MLKINIDEIDSVEGQLHFSRPILCYNIDENDAAKKWAVLLLALILYET
jgi:hypothetical protein